MVFVKQYMIKTITSQIKLSELQQLLLSFVHSKKKLNFGQLVLVHHKAFGGESSEAHQLATAIELLILSFDMFDDLEDLDNMKEPWMQVDPSIALNAATTLYTLSQQTVLALSSPSKLQILNALLQYSIQAMEGQHEDLQNTFSTEEECLKVMKSKSGSLIALACVSGMLLAEVKFPEVEEYAYQLGIAAQIENDFRDLFNPLKKDSTLEKKSLALLYLQKSYNEHALEVLTFLDSKKDYNETYGSIEQYKKKLAESGVAQYLNVMKQIALNRATKMIDELPIEANHIEELKSHLILNSKTN